MVLKMFSVISQTLSAMKYMRVVDCLKGPAGTDGVLVVPLLLRRPTVNKKTKKKEKKKGQNNNQTNTG
jgi:hypothetical protein